MTDAIAYLDDIVSANNLEGFKDVFWNLGQVVAWVETRSPFPVDALSDSTKDLARRDHSMPAGLPHFAAEVADRCADENGLARVKSPFQSLHDVRRAVLRSLQSGLMTASGQRRGSSDREPVTSLEWADLTFDDSLTGEITVRHREGWTAAWTDVRIKGADVISSFPMPARLSESLPVAVPPIIRLIPKGYYALERAVLLIARELDQTLWDHAKMTLAEVNAYERLGETTHYKDLGALLKDIEANRRDRKTGRLQDNLIEERLKAYQESQKVLRAALHAGELRSFLQVVQTGEPIEQDAAVWIQEDAKKWFDDGLSFREADRVWALVVIDKDSFSDWYYSAAGPMAEVEAKEKDQGGRPREYDWDAVKEYALGLVQELGIPDRSNQRLPSKAELVEDILNQWAKKDIQLAESTVRRYVNGWLKEV